MDRILALIPVHNRREMTLNILSELDRLQTAGFVLDKLIIDDGSTDGTTAAVMARFPEVKVESGDGNLWWGGALNVGYRYALKHGYDYVYTLNDDIILRTDTLIELYNAAKNNLGTICGSVNLRESGLILSAGFVFSALLGKVKNPWLNRHYDAIQEDMISCQTLTTSSTLIPSEVLKRGIFMDEKRFPHNFADYDFFDRARRNGFRIVAVKQSVVESGVSTSNFHHFIMCNKIGRIIASFFDIKYANNFRTQWNIASRNTNFIFAPVRFVCFVFPIMVWLAMRCILTRKKLADLLIFFGKYECGDNAADEAR